MIQDQTPIDGANATNGAHARGWHEAFLAELRQTGCVKDACAKARIARSTAYRNREDDAEFAKAWDSALEDAGDMLEREAFRRAVEGVEEPVFHQGVVVGHNRRYSDQLLILLLKAAKKEKFADLNRTEISGKGDAPLALVIDTNLIHPKQP